ncbi:MULTISPECIES: hypothetical protein [unclassified Roseovarius]|uniref:hypothetical protein n=1 Tax=unclassified Roseovarius TaxID=2614913 RepID=UPI00273FA0C7|nr:MULTISPECIES: hypothetical protein [unclassified Roseovarius]
MPPRAEAVRIDTRFLVVGYGLTIGLFYLLLGASSAIILMLIGVGVWVEGVLDQGRLARLRTARRGDSICTFVRALDYRTTDTKIIRAVYDEIQDYISNGDDQFPLRPGDSFSGELRVDDDDLDEMVHDIATRSGRSLANIQANPFYDKVETVQDLIRFLNAQPLSKA